MHAPSSWDICLFGRFRVDRRRGILYRRDKRGVFVSLALGSRALGILGVLVERPGELVPRAEIISAVWPETTVEDSNLDVQIAALRRVLDEGRTEGSCILTIRGRGYRFTAPVTRTAEVEAVPIGIALAAAGQAVAGCHAVPEHERRFGTGIFRRWRGRGDHHRAVADHMALRDRSQLKLHL